MAGYTITHRCGHTQEHQLFGPGKERDRKIEWLAGTVCSECYRGERKAAGPMFLARLIPGFSPAAAVASVAAHKTRAADLRARAEREIGGANRIHTCGGRDDCARSYLRQASEEDRQAAYDERMPRSRRGPTRGKWPATRTATISASSSRAAAGSSAIRRRGRQPAI